MNIHHFALALDKQHRVLRRPWRYCDAPIPLGKPRSVPTRIAKSTLSAPVKNQPQYSSLFAAVLMLQTMYHQVGRQIARNSELRARLSADRLVKLLSLQIDSRTVWAFRRVRRMGRRIIEVQYQIQSRNKGVVSHPALTIRKSLQGLYQRLVCDGYGRWPNRTHRKPKKPPYTRQTTKRAQLVRPCARTARLTTFISPSLANAQDSSSSAIHTPSSSLSRSGHRTCRMGTIEGDVKAATRSCIQHARMPYCGAASSVIPRNPVLIVVQHAPHMITAVARHFQTRPGQAGNMPWKHDEVSQLALGNSKQLQ